MSRRIALYGGSFNPPHAGHLLVTAYVLATCEVDGLWLMPAFRHPFGKELAPFEDRVEMCRRIAGLFSGEAGRIAIETSGMIAFVYLVIFGSLVGFGAYAYAIHHMSPTALGTYAYVNPVVAVLLGRMILGEPITRRAIVAMVLMIGGAVIVQLGDRAARLAEA